MLQKYTKSAARTRVRTSKLGDSVTWGDPRHRFIHRYAPGKSLVDAGGLEADEKVSVAHEAGAKSLTILDIYPPERPA